MHEVIAFVFGILFGFVVCFLKLGFWIGCWKIDPECANCYAAATDNQRWGGEHWGHTAPRKWTTRRLATFMTD